jgi:uncharacterized protein
MSDQTSQTPILGNGKICYLEIPASDINHSVEFYKNVFGWHVRQRNDGSIAFDDGVGGVSGTWVNDRQPMNEVGFLVYIMVANAEETVDAIVKNGGEIVKPIERTHVTIARFRDPGGNILGIYEHKELDK